MKWISRWFVKSHSSDREYTVALAEDGETWGCSCPAWRFRRMECKHIKEVQLQTANVRIDDFFTEGEFAL